jgi:uncharacterized protein (DUF1697 family)
MITYIALFRGINVGGKNSLPMKVLVAILEELGCKNIRTYIQSGNAVFQSKEKNISTLSKNISSGIMQRNDFQPHILVLEIADIEKAIEKNPFPEAASDPATLHLGFLSGAPVNPDLSKLDKIKQASERYHLIDKFFYLHAPDGFGRSKLAAGCEKLLGVPMTFRNWKTICKVREIALE